MAGPGKTIEELLNDGELEQVLTLFQGALQERGPDPERLLSMFNLQVRLHRFEDAEETLQRALELAPQATAALQAYGRYARAEKARLTRLRDPVAAGQRASLLAPPPHLLAYSAAAVQHAQGNHAAAATALQEAGASRPRTPGTFTWTSGRTMRFVDLVDLDALTGAVLPCFTGETLLDLPFSQLRTVRFLRGATSFDALWLPTELTLVDGQLARVRVPMLYTGSGVSEHAAARSGNSTMFLYGSGYAVGIGQRDLELTGERDERQMVGILSAQQIDFDPRPAASA